MQNQAGQHGKRILYLASEGWFFKSHFLHLARKAQAEGHVIGLAADLQDADFTGENFSLFSLPSARRTRSFLAYLRGLRSVLRLQFQFRPSLVHVIGLQNIVFYGPFLALFYSCPILFAPIGLGRFWVEAGFRAAVLRFFIRLLIQALRGKRFSYVFENEDDPVALGLGSYARLAIVQGAGVDENKFEPRPFPGASPFRIATVGRMLRSKGILEAVDAVRRLRAAGHDIVLDLWGAPDPDNASSLTEKELQALSREGIAWCGSSSAIQDIWARSHMALLLSYREGLPKALVEAAACGRPVIACDVPGCRALIRNEREGLLVPPRNAGAAANAILRLAENEDLRQRYGAAARERILSGFTEKQVAAQFLEIYEKIKATA